MPQRSSRLGDLKVRINQLMRSMLEELSRLREGLIDFYSEYPTQVKLTLRLLSIIWLLGYLNYSGVFDPAIQSHGWFYWPATFLALYSLFSLIHLAVLRFTSSRPKAWLVAIFAMSLLLFTLFLISIMQDLVTNTL
ncbi:MAG: hypothetical protein WCI47_02160 [bacterium]